MTSIETTSELAAEYVRGITAAVNLLRTFDQNLPGFDRATCRRLADGVEAMAQSAAARLGVTPADPDEPEMGKWDAYVAGIREGCDFAVRGSRAEAWIKAARDEEHPKNDAWYALDNLLDKYRLHADTGTRFGEETGPGDDPHA